MARRVLIALCHLVARSAVVSRIMPLVGLRLCRPLSRAAPPKPSPQSSALPRVSSPPRRVSHSPRRALLSTAIPARLHLPRLRRPPHLHSPPDILRPWYIP